MDSSPQLSPRVSRWHTHVASSARLTAITHFAGAFRALRPNRRPTTDTRPGERPQIPRDKWTVLRRGARLVASLDESRLWAKANKLANEDLGPKGDDKADWWDQGDVTLHNEKCFQARLELRKHPMVMEQLQRWWELVHVTYIGPVVSKGLAFEDLMQAKPKGLAYGDYVDLQCKVCA